MPINLEWYGWPNRPCDTKCTHDCRGRAGCMVFDAWRARYDKEFGRFALAHYEYPHDPARIAAIKEAAAQEEQRKVHDALGVLAAASGIPRDDLKAMLLMRQYRASLPAICRVLTGRHEMRVLSASTPGDPSVGNNGDEAFLVVGQECMDEGREEMRHKFIEFCETFMDGRVTVGYDDECPDCGAALGDSGVCPDAHCISNREEASR